MVRNLVRNMATQNLLQLVIFLPQLVDLNLLLLEFSFVAGNFTLQLNVMSLQTKSK